MDHESLHRKLAQLEQAIDRAHSAALPGDVMLSGVSLTLNDAVRVAANIRNRLAGTPRPEGEQSYHATRRPIDALTTGKPS